MRRSSQLAAVLACLPLGGCVSGFLYQHTTQPLDLNLRENPTGEKDGATSTKDLNLYYVRVMWDGNDVKSAAASAGIQTVHYADHEVFSILGGLWRQDYVHVYGR